MPSKEVMRQRYLTYDQFEKMTPQEMYERLKGSSEPDVRSLAHDYAIAANLSAVDGVPSDEFLTLPDDEHLAVHSDLVAVLVSLSGVFTEDGTMARGINARLAELLFLDRTKTGGNYNRVIQAVKFDLMVLFDYLSTGNKLIGLSEYNSAKG